MSSELSKLQDKTVDNAAHLNGPTSSTKYRILASQQLERTTGVRYHHLTKCP